MLSVFFSQYQYFMKINIENKKKLQANILVDSIENYFEKKSAEFEKLTYSSSYEISKRTFNEYNLDEIIRNSDIFGFSAMLIKDLAELPIYKKLYKLNLEIKKEYHNKIETLQHRECHSEIDFVEKVYKFIRPIIAKKLEKYLIKYNFVEKCVWIDEFKSDFSSLIKLFDNPI